MDPIDMTKLMDYIFNSFFPIIVIIGGLTFGLAFIVNLINAVKLTFAVGDVFTNEDLSESDATWQRIKDDHGWE